MIVAEKKSDGAKTSHIGWNFWLCRIWLPVGLFIQLTGFFWLPNTHLYKTVVTNFLLTGALLALFGQVKWRSALQTRLFQLILLYLIYMSTIPFVQRNEEPQACAHWSMYIVLYLVAIGYALQISREKLKLVLLVSAAICAIAVIYGLCYDLLFLHLWSDTYRFTGRASLYNPLRSGHLFGFFSIVALWLAIVCHDSRLRCWSAIGIAAICLLGIFLTGSRSPLLGIATSGFYLIYLAAPKHARNKSLVLASLTLIGLCIFFWPQLAERGLSLRPEIWLNVMQQSRANLWFGAGYHAPLTIKLTVVDDQFFDSHNIALAVLYKGGLIGVLLFFGIHLRSFFETFRRRRSSSWAVLAGALMLYGLTTLQSDGGSIIGRPDEFWLLLWFPIALWLHVSRNPANDPEK